MFSPSHSRGRTGGLERARYHMPRVSRATTAAPASAPARAKGGSPKRKAASAPAAASPSKRATSSNRQQAAPAHAPARCVAELNPHGAEFNASGLGSHFVGSSAPRQRAAVCYDNDPFRSRRKPRGEGRAAAPAPARSKQAAAPKRSKVGSGLSRTDRRMIPTRPAPARPAAPRPEADPPAGSPGVGQRVEVYWQGSKTWHAGVVRAAEPSRGAGYFVVQYDTQGARTEHYP